MAKIMLHGATMGTNFGDFLFAKLFYEKICEYNKDGETYFYESKYAMSDFFKSRLKYNTSYSKKKLLEADALIYISGGYFGERRKGIKESVLRFLRYMFVGCCFLIRNKPIAIIGVGAGPLSMAFLRFITKKIFNHASVITVRDEESKKYLEDYHIRNEILVTSDTVQVLSANDFNIFYDRWVEGEFKSKKYIFLHVNPYKNGNELIIEKIVKPLNEFLKNHQEYGVIIGCDQYNQSVEELKKVKKHVMCDNTLLYYYDEPLSLCSLLNQVDLIITTKLHVGIVGAICSKSVISISGHSEKILRYYQQIGENGRTIPLTDCFNSQVIDLLNKYHDNPIILDSNIIDLALQNFAELDKFLNDIKVNKRNK